MQMLVHSAYYYKTYLHFQLSCFLTFFFAFLSENIPRFNSLFCYVNVFFIFSFFLTRKGVETLIDFFFALLNRNMGIKYMVELFKQKKGKYHFFFVLFSNVCSNNIIIKTYIFSIQIVWYGCTIFGAVTIG
jgi:hypothetical protein